MILVFVEDTLSCLRQLYYDTNGPEWTVRLNWDTSDDYCSFAGVSCFKNSTEIESIQLIDNNMEGQLPRCFPEIEAHTVFFLLNKLSGPFPNVSNSLKRLDVYGNEFSALPENWCDSPRDVIRFSENPVEHEALSACYLSQPSTNYTGLSLSFSSGIVNIDRYTCFMVAGCDLKLVVLHFENVSTLSGLDLAGTGVTSDNALNLSELSQSLMLIEFGGAHIELAGEFQPFIYSIDVSGCYFDRLFDFLLIPNGTSYFVAKDAGIVGFGPTVDEVADYELSSNKYFDFIDNPLFCQGGDAFPCIYLDIIKVEAVNGRLHIDFTAPRRLNLGILLSDLSVLIKNFSNADTSKQLVVDERGCQFSQLGDVFAADCDATDVDIPEIFDAAEDFAIAYKGVEVSENALNVYKEIREMLENPAHEEYSEESSGFDTPLEKGPLRYEMTCTAMSHCGDYSDFVKRALKPFYDTYPEVAALVQYNYVSFSEPLPFYSQNGTSMHGQLEVYDDKLLACANMLLDDALYVELTHCYAEQYNIESCLFETLEMGAANDILICAEDEAQNLLYSHVEQEAIIQSEECPTLYMRRADEAFYTKICQGWDCKSNADKMKSWVCQFLGDDGAAVC